MAAALRSFSSWVRRMGRGERPQHSAQERNQQLTSGARSTSPESCEREIALQEILPDYKSQDNGLAGFDEQEEKEKGFNIEIENECEPSSCLYEGVPINAWSPTFYPCDFKHPSPQHDSSCKRFQGAPYLQHDVELSDHVLGEGSYGSVIVATHCNLKVAAKPMCPVLQVSPHFTQLFEECETLRNIRHPNIVQFMGIYMKPDDDTSAPYLIMELMKGGSLYRLVDSLQKGSKIVDLQRKTGIIFDVICALSYLHNEQNIAHCDLSSSNVLLTDNLKAKVSDLGRFRPFATSYNKPSTLAPGCHLYRPPESLVEGSQFSPKVDIFSFGVIVIELMIEKHPRPTRAVQVSEMIRRNRDLCSFQHKAPDSLQELVLPCLNNNPEKRPSAKDLASKLQNLMDFYDYVPGEFSVMSSNPGVGQPEHVNCPQEIPSPLFEEDSFLFTEDAQFSTAKSQDKMPFAVEFKEATICSDLLQQVAFPPTSNNVQGMCATEEPFSYAIQESQKDIGILVTGSSSYSSTKFILEKQEESDCKNSSATDSHDTTSSFVWNDHSSFLSIALEKSPEQCSKELNSQNFPTQSAPMKLYKHVKTLMYHCLLTEYPVLAQTHPPNVQCQATHSQSAVSLPFLALNSKCFQIKQVSYEYFNVHSWILDVVMKRSIANTTLCVNNFKMFMALRVSEAAFNLVEQMSYVLQHFTCEQCFNSQPNEHLLNTNKTATIIPLLYPPFSCPNTKGDSTSVSLCSTIITKSSTTHNVHSNKTYFSAVFFQASLALYSDGVITSAFFCSTLVSKNSMVHTFQAESIILAVFRAKIFLYTHSTCLLLKVVFISLEMTPASRFRFILVEQVLWYLPCVIPLLDEKLSQTSAIDYETQCSKNGHLHPLMCRLQLSLTNEDHIVSVHRVCLMAKLFSLLLIYSFSRTTPCFKGSPSCTDKINLGLFAVNVSEVSPNRSKTSCHPLTHTLSHVGLDAFKELESLLLHSHHKGSGHLITESHRIYHIAKRKLYWLICSLSHHQSTSRFSTPSNKNKISLAFQGPSQFDLSPLNLKQPNLDLKGSCTFDVSEAPVLNFKLLGKIKRSYLDFSLLTHIHFPDCQSLILHSCLIKGGDQIIFVHLLAMLKLYWLINSPLYHQSTSCFDKVPSHLALQGTGFNISVSGKWPQNGHYESIGDEIMGVLGMYLIAELRIICSPSHNKTTSHSAFSPSYKSMINLGLLNYLNLSLPHMQPIRISMTQFLPSLITGNTVDMTPQMQQSKTSSLTSSAPTHSNKKNPGLSSVNVSDVSILQPNQSRTSCHDCSALTRTPSPVCLDGFKGLGSLILHCLPSRHKVNGYHITESHRMCHIAKQKLYWLICSLSRHQTTSHFNSSPSDERKISLALQGPSLNLKPPNLDLKGSCTFDISETPLLNFKQPGKIKKTYLVLTHMHFPDSQSLIPHYLHSHHIEGGDQIAGVHLFTMLKLYWLINSPLCHQSTFCFNKAPSRLALQGTGCNISASGKWPQNGHYESIGDEIMCMHMMYSIAVLRFMCSSSHTSYSAFSPSFKSMINLALQGPSPVNLSELCLDLNLSLPHVQQIGIAMTQFLILLITGSRVDMTLQIQWSKASLISSAPTHPCSTVFIGLMWSLKLHCLPSCHSRSGDQITGVCGVYLMAMLTASWVSTSLSRDSKLNLTVEALYASHPSLLQNLKQSICRATYSAQLHGTVLQSNTGNCDDKSLQIRCNDVIQVHPFTSSKLLIELIGSKTLWYRMMHCLYSPHNTSGEQIMCVHRVHLIGNLKLHMPSCSPSHPQTTHFNACSSHKNKMNLALRGPSALIESEPPFTDLEQPIFSVLHLPHLHGTALHANYDSERCCGSGNDPISKVELGNNTTGRRKSGRGDKLELWMRKLLKSEGIYDDQRNKGTLRHLTQKAASQCGPKHLEFNLSSGSVMRESRHRTSTIDYKTKCSKNGHLHPLMCHLQLSLTSEYHIVSVHRVCLMAKLKLFSLLLMYSFSRTTPCFKGSPSCADKINLGLFAVHVSEVSANRSKTSCHPLTHTPSHVGLDAFKGLESLLLHCLRSHHKGSGHLITESHRMCHIAKRKLYWLICSLSHHQSTSRFSTDPISKAELEDNATGHRKSGRGDELELWMRKPLKSEGNYDDQRRKGIIWHLTQKAAPQCGPKHLEFNLSSGLVMRESRHRTEVFMITGQCYSRLHQGRVAFGVKLPMLALTSSIESMNSSLCSSRRSLMTLLLPPGHHSKSFPITEAKTDLVTLDSDLSTFSHILFVGSKVLWSTTWHNARGDHMTSTLMFECCEVHLFTKPFWLASISGYHTFASFLFQPNAYGHTRRTLVLQRPNTLSILDTSFLDLKHQQIKVISSPQSDKSSQNTGGGCGEEDCSKKDKDSSGDDRPRDTGSGQGPPGSGAGDGNNDDNSAKNKFEELQFEESEEKSSDEENDAHSDERQTQRPQFNPEKLWNAVKKDSIPACSSGRSGSLVTPCLQSKFLSLLSGAYIFSMFLQYRQKISIPQKLEGYDTVIVHLPSKGCHLLSTSCTCVLVVCNDSLCIHLYVKHVHLCLRITLPLIKWKEKSLKPNLSIMCEGASLYTEQSKEKWLYPRKTGPQYEPGNVQNVAVSFSIPISVSEKTECLRKTRSGLIPVNTTLAPVSYHAPITHYRKPIERPENQDFYHATIELRHQNAIYVSSERPPVKKRQSNIGGGQEHIELTPSQHTPQILNAQSTSEQQGKKNEVQEPTTSCQNIASTSQSNTLPNFAINTLGAPAVKPFWYSTCTTFGNVELKESEFSTAQQEDGLVSKACSELVSVGHQVPPSKYTLISLHPLPILRYETSSSTSDDSQYFDAFENKSESIVETEISAHNGSEPKYHGWEEAEEYTDVCSPSTGTGDQGCKKRDDECLEQPVECKDNGEVYPYVTHHVTPNKKQTFCLLSDSDVNRMREYIPESIGQGIRVFPPTISSCLEQDTGAPCMSPVQESPVKPRLHQELRDNGIRPDYQCPRGIPLEVYLQQAVQMGHFTLVSEVLLHLLQCYLICQAWNHCFILHAEEVYVDVDTHELMVNVIRCIEPQLDCRPPDIDTFVWRLLVMVERLLLILIDCKSASRDQSYYEITYDLLSRVMLILKSDHNLIDDLFTTVMAYR